jgi:hypothetical protein
LGKELGQNCNYGEQGQGSFLLRDGAKDAQLIHFQVVVPIDEISSAGRLSSMVQLAFPALLAL